MEEQKQEERDQSNEKELSELRNLVDSLLKNQKKMEEKTKTEEMVRLSENF